MVSFKTQVCVLWFVRFWKRQKKNWTNWHLIKYHCTLGNHALSTRHGDQMVVCYRPSTPPSSAQPPSTSTTLHLSPYCCGTTAASWKHTIIIDPHTHTQRERTSFIINFTSRTHDLHALLAWVSHLHACYCVSTLVSNWNDVLTSSPSVCLLQLDSTGFEASAPCWPASYDP